MKYNIGKKYQWNQIQFFEKNNKIDKYLPALTNKSQIIKIGSEGGNITTDFTEIQSIKRDYHEQIIQLSLDGTDKFFERYKVLFFKNK